jgi:hypothetical protein
MRAREAGDSLLMVCRPLRGLIVLYIYVPGACAPGFMPTPASQAKKLSAHTQFTCHHSQLCYTPRMPTKKQTKTHTSSRKKTPALSATRSRSKRAASKLSTSTINNKPGRRKLSERERRKLEQLTLKMFQMTYDAYQQGKLHLIF